MYLGEANCLTCGKKFKKRHSRHQFDKRQCFLIHRYKSLTSQYNYYRCGSCGACVALGFDPKKKYALWANFKCPICHLAPGNINSDRNISITAQLSFHYVTYASTIMS